MAIPRNLANIAPHVNASSTELVVNDGGANLDFRVEGDTNANTLFVDASTDRVGIGTNTPARSLHILDGSNSLVIERTTATSSALLMVAASNSIEIYARASNSSSTARELTFYAGGGDNVLSLNANRTIKAYSTVSVGDATPSASGAGITFPATQSASSDANTLDDYEEGTWTPSLGGNTTYTAQTGTYTKIGNLVYIQANLHINSIGTGSTSEISGLPFSASGGNAAISLSYFDVDVNVYWLNLYAEGTVLKNRGQTALDGAVNSLLALYANSKQVVFSGVYHV